MQERFEITHQRVELYIPSCNGTYSELFFSAEKQAGNLKIRTAAQRARISTSCIKHYYII